MGNITEYSSPLGQTLQPTDAAASTAREAGMTINRFAQEGGRALGNAITDIGGQIGRKIDDHNASQMIGQGSAALAQAHANLVQQWNKVATDSDPNDTSVASGFNEKVFDPWAQKFMEQYGNSPYQKVNDWAQATVDSARREFYHTISADMSTRAGLAVQKNSRETITALSNTVAANPSSLPYVMTQLESTVHAMVGGNANIEAGQQARIEEEMLTRGKSVIAKSAFYGMAQANPKAAAAELDKPGGIFATVFNEEEKVNAEQFARRQLNMAREDENHAYQLQQRQKHDAAEKAQNGYVSNIIAGKGVSLQKVAADPSLTPAERENVVNFAHSFMRQQRENVDNAPHPTVVRQLLNDMFTTAQTAPNNLNVQKIRDMFAKGQLNPQEETYLESRFNALDKPMERNFQSQMMHVERTITSSPFLQAQPGAAALAVNQLEVDAHSKLDQWRQQGKDVTPLLDPKSSEYLFSSSKINSYIMPPQKAISEQADAIRAAAAAPEMSSTEKMLRGEVEAASKEGGYYASKAQAKLDAYLVDQKKNAPVAQPGAAVARAFASMQEAESAKLKPGTRIIINGKSGVWQ